MFEGRFGRVRALLGIAMTILAVLLIATDGPFSGGVAEHLARGSRPDPIDYWSGYGWPVAALGLLVFGALAATVPRWIGPEGSPLETPAAPPRTTRAGLALVLAAMLTGGWLGLPRLPQSLWDDETTTASNAVHGAWRWDEDRGQYRFQEVPWSQVFYGYSIPNNHIPHSILARFCVRLAEAFEEDPDRIVDEVALRMPAFVSGILAIGALAVFLLRLGFGTAGVLAAWLLAVHPWMVRYLSEARGYSLAMLAACLLGIASLSVLRRGRWTDWLGYGASQVLLLWVFPPVVYYVAAVNLAVLATLWRRYRARDEGAVDSLLRFVMVNGLGALLWLGLMLPNLVQLLGYLDVDRGRTWMTEAFVRNLGAHLLAGMDYRHGGWPLHPELVGLQEQHPLAVPLLAAAGLALLGVGALRAAWRPGQARDLLPALLLPGLLSFGQLWIANDRVYIWYFVFYLPFLLALVALGATWIGGSSNASPARRVAALALGLATLVGVSWLGAPARETLRSRAYFPLRESVLVTRPVLHPNDPRNREILTGSWSAPARYYDPRHRWFVDEKGLRSLMREADRRELPLFVNLGRLNMARRRSAECLEIVQDPARFELVAELPGFTPNRSRVVYRYRGSRSSPEVGGRRPATDPGR